MSPRMSRVTSTEVEYYFQLVFDEGGSVRLTRSEGKLDRGERSMGMLLKVPRSLWQTPTLRATVEIADPGNPRAVIDVKAASEAVSQALGIDIDLVVQQPPEQV